MGNHNSKAEQIHYDPKEWEETEKSSLYEVMRSRKGQQGNLYHFNIKSHRDLDDEVEIYSKRRSAANWIQVIGANLTSGGFGFCGTQESALVLTERIPLLLNSIPRLNKQQSLVVLYNAIRGLNDISKMIVPAGITDKMIGFTRDGQTKVWINENFGMNYPSHFIEDAKLNEGGVISNILSALVPKTDLDAQLVSAINSSGSFATALGFIRNRGGVPENVLEANRINVTSYLGQGQVSVSNNTSSVFQPPVQQVQPFVQQTVTPQYTYQPSQPSQLNQPSQPFGYHQSWVPPTSTISQGGYRNPSVQFGQTPGLTSNYGSTSTYQPSNIGYQPVRV